MIEHEFIEVGNRRWCVGCDLFEKKRINARWRPRSDSCPAFTPYAKQKRELADRWSLKLGSIRRDPISGDWLSPIESKS